MGCVSCHGRVDLMAQVRPAMSLPMSWCLDCHRDPDLHLRPLDKITDLDWYWYPDGTPRAIGSELRRALDVNPQTDCSTCHR